MKIPRVRIEFVFEYAFAFLLTLPIFFSFGGGSAVSLYSGIWSGQKGGITLPIAAIVSIFFMLLRGKYLLRIILIWYRSGLTAFAIMYIIVSAFSLLIGMMRFLSVNAILFFFQMISPIIFLFLGIYFARKPRHVKSLFLSMIFGASVASWGLFLQSIAERGIKDTVSARMLDYIGPFYIWGIADYFPLVLAYMAILGVAFFFYKIINWKKFLFFVAPLIIILPLIWSKGAVLTFIFGVASLVMLTVIDRQLNKRVLIFNGFLAFFIVILLLSPQKTILVQRLQLDTERGYDISVTSRISRWEGSLNIISSTPWIGIAFAPELAVEGNAGRVFRSHNQYLDLWLKGGIFVVLAFFLMAIWAIWGLIYRYRLANFGFERGVIAGILAGWIAVLLVSNMSQINFGQPYTGNILWFSLGLVEGYFFHKKRRLQYRILDKESYYVDQMVM